jgi:hypothetical protein
MPKFSFSDRKKYDFDWPDPQQHPEIPEEQRIRFKMRYLTVSEKRQIDDNQMTWIYGMVDSEPAKLKFNAGTISGLLLKAIVGWDNVMDDDNNKVPFTEENLDHLFSCNGGMGETFDLKQDLISHIRQKNWSASQASIISAISAIS